MSIAGDAAAARSLLPRKLHAFNPASERRDLLEAFDAIVLAWHTLAVGGLLADGVPNLFRRHLLRIAEDGVRLQRLCAARQFAAPPASKSLPLVAALAAGDLGLAAELARATRDSRATEDHEYEDEFVWGRLLADLAGVPVAAPDVVEARIEALMATKASQPYLERIAAVRALVARDQDAFSAAFIEAARTYDMDIEEQANRFGTSLEALAPNRFVWLEGLALLRLAAQAGLAKPDRDIRFCPPLALVSVEGRDVAGPPLPLGAWE